MTIIANLKAFTLAHNIIVMDENKVIATTKATIKNIPEVIGQLADTYKCNKIVLSGSKMYTKGISDKIKECYKVKYKNNEELEIECI